MKTKFPDRYCFPAVFSYEPGKEISVVFYDLELATCGKSDEDALRMAKDALGGRLELMEEYGEEIPKPTSLSDIPLGKNQTAVLVDVYMPTIRLEEETRAVKRTVTLPAWMNAKAMEVGVNFSQVLQEALKERLGVA